MLTQNLGYPRIGARRELKKAEEAYWAEKQPAEALLETARKIRIQNWKTQQQAGIDLIPSNDFSLYDQVLDTSLMVGAVPERYRPLTGGPVLDLYFAMARGVQRKGIDIGAMEMTKWFDTNYHYIVPEFTRDQGFSANPDKPVQEFAEALALGIPTKPVLLGPLSYLILGKEKESGFDRITLLERLVPVYVTVIRELASKGAEWIQLDEPALTTDLTPEQKKGYESAYATIRAAVPEVRLLLATYFGDLLENSALAASLPVDALHIDVTRGSLLSILDDPGFRNSTKLLSVGIVDGRNIWKNDLHQSLLLLKQATAILGPDRVLVAPSCSLLHTPLDLDAETEIPAIIKNWLAFSRQKLDETVILRQLATQAEPWSGCPVYQANQLAVQSRKTSPLIHRPAVKERLTAIRPADFNRQNPFPVRKQLQQEHLRLPLFPTTTIGSFPQTTEIRQLRAQYKKGDLTETAYNDRIRQEIADSIRWQEEIGMDVLVHGEFERNDMVEYFGERLSGFIFTRNGWVQSYGSRCVKPPVIYGDVERPQPMTVPWASAAQSLTSKPVKGMLTGPVTILQWSFVRDDQPRKDTAYQLALAIRDEVTDLEKAGIAIIQIDEPAIREGLPLRRSDWDTYLDWAVAAFRLSASGVTDQTQIHTHMCYSEFNDIITSISAMDADVITIETSRSQMELLQAFADFRYPNDIGPGVYDIHSPRIPETAEMVALLQKALQVIPSQNLWVNPDCGLKTRQWPETKAALERMIAAAQALRQ